jgi:secreted PhoX family phosphatase
MHFVAEGARVMVGGRGRKLAVNLGDDSPRGYAYMFVSTASWDAALAQSNNRLAIGGKYLDVGTLNALMAVRPRPVRPAAAGRQPSRPPHRTVKSLSGNRNPSDASPA